MTRFVYSLDPYRITACYAIFCIVRAEENVKNFVEPTSLEGPIQELLGNLMSNADKGPLHSQFSCDGTCETVGLQRGSPSDISHQSSQREVELSLPSEITGKRVTYIAVYIVGCDAKYSVISIPTFR
jgi:hypothetical protein